MSLTEQQEKDALRVNMFEGDFGVPGDKTFSDKFVKAAKQHICNHCYGAVMKGERHRLISSLFDGEVATSRYCEACCLEMSKVFSGQYDQGLNALEDRIFKHQDKNGDPRPGTLRYWVDDHTGWNMASPGELLFSTVTMAATQYWDAQRGWINIY